MSGFSADWLDLREPVDAASRDVELNAELLAWRQKRGRLSVLDLGSGTGANFRYLAPLLGGEQRWWLVDNDPALLAHGEELCRRWMTERESNPSLEWRLLDLTGDWEASIHLPPLEKEGRGGFRAGNGAENPPSPPFSKGGTERVDLVTASALIDLVSAAWLERFARRCREWRAAVFVALSYDGRMAWEPDLEYDERVREHVNRHQRTDKGFGPALGPDAPATLAILLRQLGYWVMLRPSPWLLEPERAALQAALLEGWVEAVRAIAPESTGWLNDWAAQRHRLIEQGASRLYVGHWDLFAWLKGDVSTKPD